jgi:hypothetical protein
LSSNQRIGFGKKVRWEWLLLALRLRAKGEPFASAREELVQLIAETNPGKAAIAKILSNLRQVVFEPLSGCEAFAEQGSGLFRQHGASAAFPVLWGLSITSYSFFAQSGETIGRLLRLNADFTAAEMGRRLTERAGDRAFVSRVARYNLSSMLDWQLLSYDERTKRYSRGRVMSLADPEMISWMAESVLLASGKTAMQQSQVFGSNLLFPFEIRPTPLTQVAAANHRLHILRQSLVDEMIALD